MNSKVTERKKKTGEAEGYFDRIARMYPMPPTVNPIRARRRNAAIGSE